MRRSAFLLMLVAAVPAFAGVAQAAVSTTITPTRTLSGSTTFAFSERVRSVNTSNVVLRRSGSAANLLARVSCRNGSNVAVSCSSSNDIRKVFLRPVLPLVPGQVYSATVNPSGATPVTDATLTAVPARTSSFRGSMVEQETSAIAAARWRSVSASGAYGGSVVMERTAGATATFSFTGTSLYWYTRTGPDQGSADVYIDGVRKRTFDNFAPTTTEKVRRVVTRLSNKRHRAVIRVRGQSSAPGGGTWVVLDAFAQGGRMFTPAITYRWARPSASGASGGRMIASDARGASVDFRFRGKGVDWYTITGPDQGRAQVYVDGVLRQTVDNYAAARAYGVRRSVAGLTDGEHTLRVRVLGTKSSAATRALVSIDRWVVRYPSIAAFKGLGAWIDLYDYGIDIPNAVADMDARGVRTLYIQTARYTTTDRIADPVKLGRWIDEAHARGIKVIGWYFPAYGDNLAEDLRKLRAIVTFRTPAGRAMD
ncbi:MAG TPA: hypothetical protein VM600_08915, partial [Actinomycetota bacterium]|nr:hypothetical protein [Actinomycetota bacterium]